jgi:hypothetical protein
VTIASSNCLCLGEALATKVVELALGGDTLAQRMCLDRIALVRKDGTVEFEIGQIDLRRK